MRIFKKSVYFLFESGSLDSPGGPSSNRRFSIPCFAQWMVTGLKAALWPSLLIFSITIHWSHLIRRPYAKRRGRRETMFDCPLSKTVKILDQRSCRRQYKIKILNSLKDWLEREWRGRHAMASTVAISIRSRWPDQHCSSPHSLSLLTPWSIESPTFHWQGGKSHPSSPPPATSCREDEFGSRAARRPSLWSLILHRSCTSLRFRVFWPSESEHKQLDVYELTNVSF